MRVSPGPPRRLDHLGDGEVLHAPRARREVVRVAAAARLADGRRRLGAFRVDQQRRAEPAQDAQRLLHLPGAHRREVVGPGVGEETLEAEHAGLVERRELAEVPRHGPAPETDVHVAAAIGRCSFGLQGVRADGGGHAVQRHVDQGGDPAGGGRPGRGREALPLGVARLADVHVRVDQAGQQHGIGAELDHPRSRGAGSPRARRPRYGRQRSQCCGPPRRRRTRPGARG